MEKIELFFSEGKWLTNIDLFESLIKLKANETDILYIHSSLNFGQPNNKIPKNVLLESILDVFFQLEVSTLIFPTYTFSFCNGEGFDVTHSKSKMGVLNEFVRKSNYSIRSIDPLMSNVLVGKHKEFILNIGKSSVGINSTFDLLHKTNLDVKFLFLGPKIGECFTHMHFIEAEREVPYRYYRNFAGLINNNGYEYSDNYELFVRYDNVFAGEGSFIYENLMIERGINCFTKFGSGRLSIISEKPAYNTYVELLELSPSFYLKEPFDLSLNSKAFEVHNMVAL
jgi:aminoglycoside 3-N-acetyltransferase